MWEWLGHDSDYSVVLHYVFHVAAYSTLKLARCRDHRTRPLGLSADRIGGQVMMIHSQKLWGITHIWPQEHLQHPRRSALPMPLATAPGMLSRSFCYMLNGRPRL